MKRTVSSQLELTLSGPTQLIFNVAAAAGTPLASESISVLVDGARVEAEEITDYQGTRLHRVRAAGNTAVLDYRAVVDGLADPAAVNEIDKIVFLRPSRYCESDSLGPDRGQRVRWAARARPAGGRRRLGQSEAHLRRRVPACPPTVPSVRCWDGKGCAGTSPTCPSPCCESLNVPARMAAVYAPG